MASSDVEKNKEVYHKVKSHLENNGIDDFYIKFHDLHVPNEIVSFCQLLLAIVFRAVDLYVVLTSCVIMVQRALTSFCCKPNCNSYSSAIVI